MTNASINEAAVPEACDHHWVSAHQPDFPPAVYWIDQCSLCGAYNGARLGEQVTELLARRDSARDWAAALEAQLAAIEAEARRIEVHATSYGSPDGYNDNVQYGRKQAARSILSVAAALTGGDE